jgi:hypothetical protein
MSAIVGSSSALAVGGVALTAYVVGNQVASLAGDGWELECPGSATDEEHLWLDKKVAA